MLNDIGFTRMWWKAYVVYKEETMKDGPERTIKAVFCFHKFIV